MQEPEMISDHPFKTHQQKEDPQDRFWGMHANLRGLID
jgi:hypothetical protein